MNEISEIIDNLMLELKRGTIVMSVMSQLHKPTYGYSLVQTLTEKGYNIDASTLYPLLRRLESQGLLVSEWETSGSKPRKYYNKSDKGQRVYEALLLEWIRMVEELNILINNNGGIGNE